MRFYRQERSIHGGRSSWLVPVSGRESQQADLLEFSVADDRAEPTKGLQPGPAQRVCESEPRS